MPENQAKLDARFAAAALRYGLRHAGLTKPNPCVAAIIVKCVGGSHVVVGRGVTALGGRPHAETLAIRMAGEFAHGATLYVTLEPCSHHGKTPPCTDAIIDSGIARVVACMSDPDKRVAGGGFDKLKNAGVSVSRGGLELDAMQVHAPHIISKTLHRPYVFLKMAVSSDGMIGQRRGGQVAISGPQAWNYVHGLRAQSDAILVGVGTVLSDDPTLTCRLPGLQHRSPMRVVLDARHQMPSDAKIISISDSTETLVLNGRNPHEVLQNLAERGVQSLMIEGGAKVAAAFLKAQLVDAVHLIQAPGSVGADGVSAPMSLMTDVAQFDIAEKRSLGDDKLTIYLRKDFECSLAL
ncbi:MAG: bifunctional diaminohydroxyphosphoribosylaminopyrimidine deaminase/5-amino-6-(5-phosphoribosylamino)uracil reductase RibD [Hyphomicrobiales bacterium]